MQFCCSQKPFFPFANSYLSLCPRGTEHSSNEAYQKKRFSQLYLSLCIFTLACKIKRKMQKHSSRLPSEKSCRPVSLSKIKTESHENNLNDNKETLGKQHLFCILGIKSALATLSLTQIHRVMTPPSTA